MFKLSLDLPPRFRPGCGMVQSSARGKTRFRERCLWGSWLFMLLYKTVFMLLFYLQLEGVEARLCCRKNFHQVSTWRICYSSSEFLKWTFVDHACDFHVNKKTLHFTPSFFTPSHLSPKQFNRYLKHQFFTFVWIPSFKLSSRAFHHKRQHQATCLLPFIIVSTPQNIKQFSIVDSDVTKHRINKAPQHSNTWRCSMGLGSTEKKGDFTRRGWGSKQSWGLGMLP